MQVCLSCHVISECVFAHAHECLLPPPTAAAACACRASSADALKDHIWDNQADGDADGSGGSAPAASSASSLELLNMDLSPRVKVRRPWHPALQGPTPTAYLGRLLCVCECECVCVCVVCDACADWAKRRATLLALCRASAVVRAPHVAPQHTLPLPHLAHAARPQPPRERERAQRHAQRDAVVSAAAAALIGPGGVGTHTVRAGRAGRAATAWAGHIPVSRGRCLCDLIQ
jgi:hypothetical protein